MGVWVVQRTPDGSITRCYCVVTVVSARSRDINWNRVRSFCHVVFSLLYLFIFAWCQSHFFNENSTDLAPCALVHLHTVHTVHCVHNVGVDVQSCVPLVSLMSQLSFTDMLVRCVRIVNVKCDYTSHFTHHSWCLLVYFFPCSSILLLLTQQPHIVENAILVLEIQYLF